MKNKICGGIYVKNDLCGCCGNIIFYCEYTVSYADNFDDGQEKRYRESQKLRKNMGKICN